MPLNFSTLILPDTIPQEGSFRQLLLYFETIFLYSATEEIPARLPKEFCDFLRHYAPVPFGEALPNFTKLLRDMTKNRGEYSGGSLSSLSAHSSALDEESVWRLIGRLSEETHANNAQHEALLQAKLLLALAEVRDQEEQEIARELAVIDGQRQLMLHGLTEEEGDEEDDENIELLAFHQSDRQQRDDTLEKRLRAWIHLFLADTKMPRHWLLSTTPDTFAILAEHTSSQIQEKPNRLLRLPLPGQAIMDLPAAEYLQQRQAWRQEMSVCLATLALGLKEAANTGVFGNSESIREKLNANSKKMPAWQGVPSTTLDIYLLPFSLAKLFAKIAKVTLPESGESPLPHGLVAVVQPLR
ncbi:MAG: hypothetical protein PHI06_01145 [Desulfobulbaceae bacterium]|nr:hypothetical protein [Desulfobulbaceae bacterium]